MAPSGTVLPTGTHPILGLRYHVLEATSTTPRIRLETTELALVELLLLNEPLIDDADLRVGLLPLFALIRTMATIVPPQMGLTRQERVRAFTTWIQQQEPTYFGETAEYARHWASELCLAHFRSAQA